MKHSSLFLQFQCQMHQLMSSKLGQNTQTYSNDFDKKCSSFSLQNWHKHSSLIPRLRCKMLQLISTKSVQACFYDFDTNTLAFFLLKYKVLKHVSRTSIKNALAYLCKTRQNTQACFNVELRYKMLWLIFTKFVQKH